MQRAGRGLRRGSERGRPTGKFTQHRILEKLEHLLESHPTGLPLRALASELGVTTRSIRRYLAELHRERQLESLPSLPGGAHLWRIKPSERARAISVRRTQAYELLAAKPAFEPLRGTALFEELDLVYAQILETALRPTRPNQRGELPTESRLEARFRYVAHPPRDYSKRADLVDDLFRATAEFRAVAIERTSGGPDPITLHPYAIAMWRGGLYLVGYDVGAGRQEVLPLETIVRIEIQDDVFSLPADFDLRTYDHGEFGLLAPRERRHRVLVEFDKTVADTVRRGRVHPQQRTAVSKDGRLRLSFVVPELSEVVRWVASFGEHAEVVEPPQLKADLAAWTRKPAKK